MLLGAFLILDVKQSVEEVGMTFDSIRHFFVCYSDQNRNGSSSDRLTVFDCWNAIHHVQSLGWINTHELQPQAFDIEEHIHYADPINGGLHIVVPNELIVFPTPVDLKNNDVQWLDDDGVRQFSAAFYADLLANEFGVSQIICLDSCTYRADHFESCGIRVEELFLDGDFPQLLHATDRLLSLLTARTGPIALHGGARARRFAGALAASHLIRHAGFEARAALAWLRMACPPLGPSRGDDPASSRTPVLPAHRPLVAAATVLAVPQGGVLERCSSSLGLVSAGGGDDDGAGADAAASFRRLCSAPALVPY